MTRLRDLWARVWRWLETRPDWIAELGDDE
jgi:hypothetical protein